MLRPATADPHASDGQTDQRRLVVDNADTGALARLSARLPGCGDGMLKADTPRVALDGVEAQSARRGRAITLASTTVGPAGSRTAAGDGDVREARLRPPERAISMRVRVSIANEDRARRGLA